MARSPRTASSVPPQIKRQARRIAKQQKHLVHDIDTTYQKLQMTDRAKSLAGARSVRFEDMGTFPPMTDTQRDFCEEYEDATAEAYVLYGSAGTGKTFLALYQALLDVLSPETPYDKVIIVRSIVSVRDMGFLPGTEEEKFAPYEQPYISVCAELFGGRKEAYGKLKDQGAIEFIPTSFLRGQTFKNTIVIAEEIANFNWSECKTLISRIGKDTKLIVCGDGAQDDLVYNKNDTSCFRDFMTVSRAMPEFRHFRFTTDDIVRSGLVKAWIIACERANLL